MATGISLEAPLTSNGYTLATTPERLGMLTPTNPDQPIALLREQYQAQGYLWLKGILDRQAVLAFRRRFFSAFSATGLLAAGLLPITKQATWSSTAHI